MEQSTRQICFSCYKFLLFKFLFTSCDNASLKKKALFHKASFYSTFIFKTAMKKKISRIPLRIFFLFFINLIIFFFKIIFAVAIFIKYYSLKMHNQIVMVAILKGVNYQCGMKWFLLNIFSPILICILHISFEKKEFSFLDIFLMFYDFKL